MLFGRYIRCKLGSPGVGICVLIALFLLTTLAPAQTTIYAPGYAVPKTFFGLHSYGNVWPTSPMGTLRIWDAGASWAEIEKSNGSFNWSRLDYLVSTARNKGEDVVYTFGRTPQWASSKPWLSCNYGPGQCAPPANLATWDYFVKQLATRYKGRIRYYEIWNEPNQPAFYSGSMSTLLTMAKEAYSIIKGIDSSAQVLTPAPTWTSTSPSQWMSQWFSIGGKYYADVVSFHAYTGKTTPESVTRNVDNMRAVMKQYGVSYKPLFNSEYAWGRDSLIPSQYDQAAFVSRALVLLWAKGIPRTYWYAWNNPSWGTLYSSTYGLLKPGVAHSNIYKWLVWATMSTCQISTNNTYGCFLTRSNGYSASIYWNPSTSVSLHVSSSAVQYRDIWGGKHSIPSSRYVTIGKYPLLFENKSAW